MKKDTNNGGEYFYLYNGHGDVVQIVDRNGNVVNNYEYDEWGNQKSSIEEDFSGTLQNWVNTDNSSIENGHLRITNNEYMRNKNGIYKDFTLEADIMIVNSAAGFALRSVDNNNFYLWQLNDQGLMKV